MLIIFAIFCNYPSKLVFKKMKISELKSILQGQQFLRGLTHRYETCYVVRSCHAEHILQFIVINYITAKVDK